MLCWIHRPYRVIRTLTGGAHPQPPQPEGQVALAACSAE